MKFFISIFALLIGFCFTANANPNESICRFYGASLMTMRTATAQSRFIDLCKFDSAMIEVRTLDAYAAQHYNSEVVQKYIDNEHLWPIDCSSSGGFVFGVLDKDGNKAFMCQFPDGTIMELETFSRGITDPLNGRMNDALGIL